MTTTIDLFIKVNDERSRKVGTVDLEDLHDLTDTVAELGFNVDGTEVEAAVSGRFTPRGFEVFIGHDVDT